MSKDSDGAIGSGVTEESDERSLELVKKLNEIPFEQLKELLTSQIDLEIQLKHRELHLTNQELNKIEAQMILLRKFFEVPPESKLANEPDDFTVKYFDLLNNSLTVSYNELKRRQEALDNAGYGLSSSYSYSSTETRNFSNSTSNLNLNLTNLPGFKPEYFDDLSKFSIQSPINSSVDNSPCQSHPFYRTRSTTSSLRPSAVYSEASTTAPQPVALDNVTPTPTASQKSVGLGCLYRRTDGVIVKLTCPQCQRSNFSSAQGFLNHSRIAHSQEYTSQDAAALKCGKIIDSIKQDFQGETSIRNLKSKNLDPNTNLNVPEINFNSCVKALSSKDQSKSPTFIDDDNDINIKNSTDFLNTINSGNNNSNKYHSNKVVDSSIQSKILLKKLTKQGKLNKSEYEKLISDTKAAIINSHLFDDEEDDDNSGSSDINKSESTISEIELRSKRRKSRGGINIISKQNIESTESNLDNVEKSQQINPQLEKNDDKSKSTSPKQRESKRRRRN